MSEGHNIDKAKIAELRATIRSAKGKIERRETAILFARKDIREAAETIRLAEFQIEQLGGAVRRR